MYIHLGQDTVVKQEEIIGIFDMDTATVAKSTRDFLSRAEKEGKIINITYDLPKSFIVCKKNNKKIIYISQISTSTLEKRAKFYNNKIKKD